MNIATKARIRHALVSARDFIYRVPFARQRDFRMMPHSLSLTQPFKQSATLESKIHNLREAADCINKVMVMPGQVFSFWHTVGNPNDKTRFREGRSIHAGVVSLDTGGGLCQASGIIHHMALIARLEVLERFNHSVDLYTEETRFAPLGTDATVFYGFKDLRLRNPYPFAIGFEFAISDTEITLRLLSEQQISAADLVTDIRTTDTGVKHVTISTNGVPVSKSTYLPLSPAAPH